MTEKSIMAEIIRNSSPEIKSDQPCATAPPTKRKRSLPGMPDPEAEVIALSPKTLMATNRFVCEICSKGFQRDQNLQLHRRGHNLPWKLRQRNTNEVVKRVYVCPEISCIHHDPARALGDLTGIKKHFCRKHGDKKYKCDRCSKTYAVQSDRKAHMKTCGTREYRCDCGTMFSRRDSFITHRAFCEALAKESRHPQNVHPPSPPQPSAELAENPPAPPVTAASTTSTASSGSTVHIPVSNGGSVFPTVFTTSASPDLHQSSPTSYSGLLHAMAATSDHPIIDPISLSLSTSLHAPSFFPSTQQPALSATALLQKAAQMGATSSTSSFLHGLLAAPPPPSAPAPSFATVKLENKSTASGLGLPSGGSSAGYSAVFGHKPTTLDFLGLGMDGGECSSGGFSAFLSSISGGLDMAAATPFAGETWEEAPNRKPSLL